MVRFNPNYRLAAKKITDFRGLNASSAKREYAGLTSGCEDRFGFLLPKLGFGAGGGFLWAILHATIGAVILLILLRIVRTGT